MSRKMSRKEKRVQAALNAFLSMQAAPWWTRLKLVWKLAFQIDLRSAAKARKMRLREMVKLIRPEKQKGN